MRYYVNNFQKIYTFQVLPFFEQLTSKIVILLKYFFGQSAKQKITHYRKLCEIENSDSLLKMQCVKIMHNNLLKYTFSLCHINVNLKMTREIRKLIQLEE